MIRFMLGKGKQSGASLSPAELEEFRRAGLPAGHVKVAAKDSSAVAFLYDYGAGRFLVKAYQGKRAKADGYYSFRNGGARETWVRGYFERVATNEGYRKESAAGKRQPHKWQVGHIFRTSWGYDQTNVDFYEIVRIVGPYSVELREIASVDLGGGHGDGTSSTCGPKAGAYTGEPFIRRAYGKDGIKIDEVARAFLWDAKPAHYSWGH